MLSGSERGPLAAFSLDTVVARSTNDFAKDANVIPADNLLDCSSPVAPLVERLRQVQQALRVTKFRYTHVSYAPG